MVPIKQRAFEHGIYGAPKFAIRQDGSYMTDKDDLALCLRMLEHQGIIDFNGHASIRVGDRILINVGAAQRSRLTADDICTIDMDGTLIEGRGKPPLEFHLHAGLYRARPDAQAIVHAHPQWSTYLTMTGHDYLPVFAQGTLLHPLPVLDTPDSINSPQMAARLAKVLGDRPAALMKSHGAVTLGADITEARTKIGYTGGRRCIGGYWFNTHAIECDGYHHKTGNIQEKETPDRVHDRGRCFPAPDFHWYNGMWMDQSFDLADGLPV